MKDRYFISFIEEGIMNPLFFDCIGGRVEITDEQLEGYAAISEIRFFTKKIDEYHKFREAYDFKYLDEKELFDFKKIVKEKFHNKTELDELDKRR